MLGPSFKCLLKVPGQISVLINDGAKGLAVRVSSSQFTKKSPSASREIKGVHVCKPLQKLCLAINDILLVQLVLKCSSQKGVLFRASRGQTVYSIAIALLNILKLIADVILVVITAAKA